MSDKYCLPYKLDQQPNLSFEAEYYMNLGIGKDPVQTYGNKEQESAYPLD